MTRAKISEYSATANDNTDVNGVDIAEGCPPSSMNNMGREIMAALKRFQVGSDGDGVTVGGALVVSGATTLTTVSATVVQSDTVNEKTSAAGVTIDGVLLKDSQVTTDQINEKTSAAGVTIDGVLLKDNGVVTGAGTVSAPVYSTTGDTNTGIFFPAADTIAFAEGGAEAMRIDSSGNVGIGTTTPSSFYSLADNLVLGTGSGGHGLTIYSGSGDSGYIGFNDTVSNGMQGFIQYNHSGDYMAFAPNGAERMRVDSSGNLMVATTNTTPATANVVGYSVNSNGIIYNTVDSNPCVYINRKTNDGELVRFYQDGTQEGNISVSGSTVSYNGGHLSRWTQTTTAKDESLKKGTVLSNLDEMNVYVDADGNDVQNEQLNKVKVSDVEGDANVAGVFVNWTYDEAHQVDEINMAMTGDMIIRIAQGTTVSRGDLLMSAGDGTAKPQGDDIVRSKTIAKVTSTHVTCTYDDGSYCVPCVLMAC